MKGSEFIQRRLSNHRLIGLPFEKPEEVVRWLGAVQAQEYPGAKWGLAQRLYGVDDAALDRAFAAGEILRTHVMRPTWHFLTPADIRWMLKLTAPRVNQANAYYYRKLELDSSFFARSNALFEKELRGGKQLTRVELLALLQGAGITTPQDDRLRAAYIFMRAELDGVICSGAMRGKQHTYALLEERVPPAMSLEPDEALAELTARYFKSHGPATIKDFAVWSGLTVSDARAGLDMAKSQFLEENLDGKSFWFSPDEPGPGQESPITHLLPAYDEYTVAYRDHNAVLEEKYLDRVIAAFGIVIIIDGRIMGTWKRTFSKGRLQIELRPFTDLSEDENQAVLNAAQRYGEFLNKPVELI